MKHFRLLIRVLRGVALLSLLPVAMAAQTVINSADDSYTYMNEASLTHNDAVLRVRTALPTQTDQTTFRNVYIKFDLRSGFSGPIGSAKLVLGLERALINSSGSINRADFYSVFDDSWQSSTLTWGNAPAKGTRLLSTLIATRSNTAPDTAYSFDVTNYVKQEYAGDKIITICITEDSLKGPDIRFNSSRSTKISPAVTSPQLIITGTSTEVERDQGLVPDQFELRQNYPNPFNPTTKIAFSLPRRGSVRVTIYNALGVEVRRLLRTIEDAGSHELVWDARSNNGSEMATGLYFCTVQFEEAGKTVKMLLLR